MNQYTPRAEFQSGDLLAGKRGDAKVGDIRPESLWSFDAIITGILAQLGPGIAVVSMPANSAAAGAMGQIAVGGGRLAIYVGQPAGLNWIFLDFYKIG